MKKYSLIFACVAFAVAVALNFSISKEGKMDDMALANVDAWAQESDYYIGGGKTCTTSCCYTSYTSCYQSLLNMGCTTIHINIITYC